MIRQARICGNIANTWIRCTNKTKWGDSVGKYSDDYLRMMQTWHGLSDKTDEKLDALIHLQMAEILERGKDWSLYNRTYFRPSSAGACQRGLYHQLRGDRKDEERKQPHQGRWQRIGTEIGGLIQRDLLHIEKHYRKRTGDIPPFVPERTSEGYPAWEQFVWGAVDIEYRGHKFSIIGEPDGILKHSDGQRIGLEIKSKQTTNAATSSFSMKAPQESHVKQITAYSIMHDLDLYLVNYVNGSKKKWVMTEEELKKTPDFRVFEVMITEDMKTELLDYWVEVLEAVEANEPPKVDLSKWTFNNYKEIIAETITEQEFADLKATARAAQNSRMLQYEKNSYADGIRFIESYRQRKGLTF